MTIYLAPEYRPRPRVLVVAWMAALHKLAPAGSLMALEAYLVELLSCAMYTPRRSWS